MEPRTILYVMHNSWHWIKQRPHFIAEQLGKYYDVDVFYLHPPWAVIKRNHYTRNDIVNIRSARAIYKVPLLWRSNNISTIYLNSFLSRKKISAYEIIWFSGISPDTVRYMLSNKKQNQIIVYDCMDDILEFSSIKGNRVLYVALKKYEKTLVEQSDIVFASSDTLKEALIRRYPSQKQKIYTINNALSDEFLQNKNIDQKTNEVMMEMKKNNRKKITYIGTISSWIDFDIIEKSLNEFSDIEYWLFGPKKVAIPNHNRIKWMGTIPHSAILNIMQNSDLLIMPFVYNKLVRAVDPVKAYEYIASGTPTLLLKYHETLKFKKWAYLYGNEREYLRILELLNNNTLKNKIQGKYNLKDFITKNNWEYRVKSIIKILNQL